MAGRAEAPIHTSIGSGGSGAMRAPATGQWPSGLSTVSPDHSARMIPRASSNFDGRPACSTPIAANCPRPPPIAHCSTNRPCAMLASVAVCSATSTGFHIGSRYSAPASRAPHSASTRPRIGEFW